jgi:hypothetical protein
VAGATAGVAGAGFVAACRRGSATIGTTEPTATSEPPVLTDPPSVTEPPESAPGTTAPPASTVVWRLSARGQRGRCRACRSHAAHRWFASAEAADAGRAHPGCHCAVRSESIDGAAFAALFGESGTDTVDDRRQAG